MNLYWAKYYILFNKFQFIDQIAIKNVQQFCTYVFTFSKAISIKHCFWHELLPLITNFWLEKNDKICIFKLIKASKHDKKMESSKSVHASDESCHIMYVTETKITFCNYFSYFIHFWLHLKKKKPLETVGGIIMHGYLFNKTIIYERILKKIASIYIT